MQKLMNGVAYGFWLREAVHLRCPVIPTGDDAVGVRADHGVMGEVNERGLAPQRLFGLLALGDIPVDSEQTDHISAGVQPGRLHAKEGSVPIGSEDVFLD